MTLKIARIIAKIFEFFIRILVVEWSLLIALKICVIALKTVSIAYL